MGCKMTINFLIVYTYTCISEGEWVSYTDKRSVPSPKFESLGRLLCIRKTYTKMDYIRFFVRDQKHERRPSYAYGFGLLCFRQTRTGLSMRARYSNEIAE